jgi:hypothetical protein
MVWSFSESGRMPGQNSSEWDSETVNISVVSVSGSVIDLQERWNGTSSFGSNGSVIHTINATGEVGYAMDLQFSCPPIRENLRFPCLLMGCQFMCFYVPALSLPSYLNQSQRAFPDISYFDFLLQNASSVSQETVSTKFGPVEAWTLSIKDSVATKTSKGSGDASISFDSDLGILLSAKAVENGTFSSHPVYNGNGTVVGQVNGSESRTLSASLIKKSSGVQLTPGATASPDYGPYLLATGAIVVIAAVAIGITMRRRGSREPPGVLEDAVQT